jgi:hypothetical protein
MADLLQKIIERDQERKRKELKDLASRSFCPVCKVSMAVAGCLTIQLAGAEGEAINGNYCTRCYSHWVAKNVPRFEEKQDV